jgi:hypothetical protein
MRSGAEEEATAFGPLIQVSAWAAWGIGCSSSRKRRSVSAATVAAKLGGRLRFVVSLRRQKCQPSAVREIHGPPFPASTSRRPG